MRDSLSALPFARLVTDRRMFLPIIVAAAGVLLLAHVAPFRFILDAVHGDVAVWRMPVPESAMPIYLTFDDGPNPTATPDLLSLLKNRNVRATFFLIDEYVTEETAPVVRRMFADGHCVAQHTGRRWLLLRSSSQVAEMLETGARKIKALAGQAPARFFRPHAGWRSDAMLRGAARAGYRVVGWSWKSWDWMGFREPTGGRVARQILAQTQPGTIMVLHDGHHRNPRADRAYTIAATREIVDSLQPSGYTFHTFCEPATSLGREPRRESSTGRAIDTWGPP